jgi:hypothetical protein
VAGIKGAFNFPAEQGTDDIAVVAADASFRILAVKLVRSQAVPGAINGGNAVVLVAGDEVTYQTSSVTNIPPGFTGGAPTALYQTANGTSFPLTVPGVQYAVIPVSEAQPGDKYQFSASYTRFEPPPNFSDQLVAARLSAVDASTVTLPLPVPLAYSLPTPAAFPSFDISYTGFAGNTDVNYSVALNWGGSLTDLTVTATAAYQNGTTTLTVPDLTGLTGFLAAPGSGTMVTWSASVSEHTSQPTDSFAVVINVGSYNEP